MRLQKNILQYFDNIIQSIKKMEKGSELFTELKSISQELEVLEQYVKTTLDTLDHNFNSFVKQINLLSELIDFQRSVTNYKSSENIVSSLFEYLQRNIPHDYGFIAFRLKEDSDDVIIATNHDKLKDTFREFALLPEINILNSLVKERDMAYLISDAEQFYSEKIHWEKLSAKSIVLFPVKVRGKFLGIGFLIRSKKAFEINDLSFINLNIGLFSLIIFQHFYFARLKSKLFKQFKLRKMLEEVKYAEYFEKGPLFIFTLDPRYIVLHANTSAVSSLARSEEMIIGENFLELVPASYRNQFRNILKQTEDGRVSYIQAPIQSKKKIKPIFEFYLSRIELQNHFSLILIFALEVTPNYHREKLSRRNDILDELDQFSRTVVGEFSNLLNIVVPNVSLIRTKLPDSHPDQVYLEAIEKATGRSANFIRKFLNYDLEEFETSEIADLNRVLKSYIQSLREETDANVKIEFQLEPGLKTIQYYPLRLRQLLKILFSNSMAAFNGKENPVIRFSTQQIHQKYDGLLGEKSFYLKAGEYVELSIFDNGCGIPSRSISQVLKPFYSTKIKNEGVGLGLFIAYNIVKDMKGEIFIESEPEKFTEIFVYFPVKQEKQMDVALAQETKRVKEVTVQKPTVLIVDDEYNIRSMMKEIMEMNGFRVFTAGNGRDGVEIFQRNQSRVDLVILDMVMPVMDGRTAFLEMRKIKPSQKIYIISGYSSKEDMDEILKKGAIGYMRKPFQVNEIIAKVKGILNIKQ